MNLDGTEKVLLDPKGWCARWSPDGRRIAYTVRERSGANIRIHDVQTKQRHVVLKGEHASRYHLVRWNFGWSPDSRRLCFRGDRKEKESEAVIVHADGSDQQFQILLRGNVTAKFSWHPDGTKILLALPDPMRKLEQLFIADLSREGNLRYLVGQPPDYANLVGTWSPDGQQIVFTGKRQSAE